MENKLSDIILSLKIGRILKITMVFLLLGIIQVSAASYAEDHRISVAVENGTFYDVISQIEKQSEFMFFYKSEEIDNNQRYTLNMKDKTASEVLNVITKNNHLSYRIVGKHIIITKVLSTMQDNNKVVSGIVQDAQGVPVAGANVTVKGTTIGTITDADGNFELKVPVNANTLSVSYIGYLTKDMPIGKQSKFKVVLTEDLQALEEVVVVGYGTQKKVNLTGAVDQVTDKVFNNRSVSNVTQALQGTIPNLNITLDDGKPTRTASYNVRGTTSIGQGGSALVLIDGVEGDPALLNPNDIASVSVLKDAASAAIYGARGSFGVVLITTKDPQKGKVSVNYTGNVSVQKPTTVPDFVTDGLVYAEHSVKLTMLGTITHLYQVKSIRVKDIRMLGWTTSDHVANLAIWMK